MKRFGLAFAFLLLCNSIWAQVPEAIKYQAVARDASGNVYENQLVQFEISILEGSSTGNSVYTETHIDTTNAFGLVTLELGRGVVVSGDFTTIDWASNSHFLEVNMDPNGGTNYQLAGTVELLSVPFALSAKTAADDNDTDPSNEIQAISKNGNQIELSDGGGFVIDEVNDDDADSTNEIQTISRSNDTIYLTDGGFAVLPVIVNNDNDSTNEIQDLQLVGNDLSITDNTGATLIDLTPYLDNTDNQAISRSNDTIYLTNGGFAVLPAEVDGDTTNEIQDLQLVGNDLSITDNTGATLIDLTPYLDNTDNQAISRSNDTIYLTNGGFAVLPAEVDGDTTNEIQDLQLVGNDLSITDNTGASVIDLTPYLDNTDNQVISRSNDTIYLTNGGFAVLPATVANNDNDSTNEIQDLQLVGNNLTITENATATSIDLSTYLDNTDNQALSISNDTIYLTNGGFAVVPVSVNHDNDSTNEIQALTRSNDTLYLSDGGNVALDDLSNYWSKNGDHLNYNDGSVGIGEDNPTTGRLVIRDTLTATRTRSIDHIVTASNAGIGMNIDLTTTAGGLHTALDASTTGSSGTNITVRSLANGSTTNYGFTTAAGVPHNFISNVNAGIYARAANSSNANAGVFAILSGGTGGNLNNAIDGEVYINGGAGSFNTGALAYSAGNGAGDNYGVEAYALNSTGNNYAIYGNGTSGASGNRYAGYFEGDVEITGNLNIVGNISKGGGTFKIDHPVDPSNKYLVHSFVESPDMMNVYNGNITTDANGFATVSLPDYFEATNKDFRYQLTVIGSFAQAIIKEKVSNNQFVIQTNQPNIEVSWQVTGIRNDNYSNANRIQPVQEKEAEDKGKYLHPEAYGLDENQGIYFKPENKKKVEELERRHAEMESDEKR
jgi:ribosomal protein L14